MARQFGNGVEGAEKWEDCFDIIEVHIYNEMPVLIQVSLL